MPRYNFGGGLAGGIAQGLQASGFSENIADEIKKAHQTNQEGRGAQYLADEAFQQGLIPIETWTKISKAPLDQKKQMIGGVVAAHVWQRQQQDEARKNAELNFRPTMTTLPGTTIPSPSQTVDQYGLPYAQPVNPSDQVVHQITEKGPQLIQTQPGHWQVVSGTNRPTDKVLITLPDGTPAYVTGGQALAAQRPADFKKKYGVTQSIFSDPTRTKRGNVVNGKFEPDDNGDYVRLNVHTDPKTGEETDSGFIPFDEWQANARPSPTANVPSLPAQQVQPPDTTQQSQTGPSQPVQVAPGYGVQAVKMQAPDGSVSMVDPAKVEYFKSKGAVVVQ